MEKYKALIVESLKKYFDEYSKNSSYSKKLWDAMAYTTLLEGKRLRGIMCLEIANLFNCNLENVIATSCALEIMHAYSLIHDDLPCMDNDDLRRGKPTNHKVFGEAIATLAGDALISFGAHLIIEKTPKTIKSKTILKIVDEYLKCAGAQGIVSGQVADIEAEGKNINLDNLQYIHKYKTGALFATSVVCPALIAECEDKTIEKLKEFGYNFGLLFQIYDDIIDTTCTTEEIGKTAGKDKIVNKLTYISAWGLDKTRELFKNELNKNKNMLEELNIKSSIFNQIYSKLEERTRI
ncbi:polyprenyl synthetase family protein [bacterium]|nr:polyprenyl synthetase family protein [bacterium]